jgi:hypothetical protein
VYVSVENARQQRYELLVESLYAAADWQSVLAKTPFLLNRCSADLRYLFISDTCARMLGRRAEDVEGKPIVDILGEEAFDSATHPASIAG